MRYLHVMASKRRDDHLLLKYYIRIRLRISPFLKFDYKCIIFKMSLGVYSIMFLFLFLFFCKATYLSSFKKWLRSSNSRRIPGRKSDKVKTYFGSQNQNNSPYLFYLILILGKTENNYLRKKENICTIPIS